MENNFLKKVSEKNKMKISVCICSYNGENYIAEQLNSIVNQTLKVDEIILSDDKSTDKTIEIAENILKNSGIDYKILINEKNQGVTKNFENSCSHAHLQGKLHYDNKQQMKEYGRAKTYH